ncbi:Rhodanese-like domain family protein [Acanthocheilonema viteae]
MNTNSPSSCNNENILQNDGSQNFVIASDILPKNPAAATELNISHKLMETESSIAKFGFGSTDYQRRSSPVQTSEISNQHVVRNSFRDLTNVSIPMTRSPTSALRFLPSQCFSMENDSEYLKRLHFNGSLCLASLDKSRSSQITNATSNKKCLSVSNGTNSFGNCIKTKQLQLHRTQRRSAFKKLDRLKNIVGISNGSSSSKLYNLLPIARFRAHLQGTSRNTLISPSLPSTSTPNKLESRYKKRHIPDETSVTGSAKKVRDESMEEGDNGRIDESFEERMDIDMAELSLGKQDSAIEGYNLGNEPDERDVSFSPTMLNRSHSASYLEIGANKEPEPPPLLEVNYELDTVKNPVVPSTAFACITARTLADLLNSMTREQFSKRFILIDCRYPFEFNGGHIRDAYNLFDPAEVENVFYPNDVELRAQIMKKKPIFYCEFSQKRGPSIAYELRALDRKVNVGRYPIVDYPEIYLLQYGYRDFYLRFNGAPDLLEPNGYVEMNDEAHAEELKNYKYHRINSVASAYHTLARDRYNRQHREELNPIMEIDVNMKTPPRRMLPRRLFVNSPESPSQFPDASTPKSRPMRDRAGDAPRRSVCRRLFDDFK